MIVSGVGSRWCLSHRQCWLTLSLFSKKGNSNKLYASHDRKISFTPEELCSFIEKVTTKNLLRLFILINNDRFLIVIDFTTDTNLILSISF